MLRRARETTAARWGEARTTPAAAEAQRQTAEPDKTRKQHGGSVSGPQEGGKKISPPAQHKTGYTGRRQEKKVVSQQIQKKELVEVDDVHDRSIAQSPAGICQFAIVKTQGLW
jgi:hypothetical protein